MNHRRTIRSTIAVWSALAAAPVTTAGDAAGSWQGTLTYRDYRTDRAVTLPADVHVRASGPHAATWRFAFTDPGRLVRSAELQVADPERHEAVVVDLESGQRTVWTVVDRRDTAADDWSLTVERDGRDGGEPARLRLTRTRDGDRIIATQSVREGDAWRMRHTLDVRRVERPSRRDRATPPTERDRGPERWLDAASARADVALAREAMARVHPGWDRHTSGAAMHVAFDRLDADIRAQDGMWDGTLLVRLSRLLAMMRCDHTKAEAPETFTTHRTAEATHLPFVPNVVDGRAFVRLVHPDAAGRLAPGDELLAVDGHLVTELLQTIAPLQSVDGWTDHVKRVEQGWSTELLGGAIDHYLPLLHGWPGSERRLTIRRAATGGLVDLSVSSITYPALNALANGDEGRWRNFDRSVTSRILDERTGLIAVGTFVNYRTNADPVAVLGPHFMAMRDAGVDHLIIDLRRCGGGSEEVPGTLLAFLMDDPLTRRTRLHAVRTLDYGTLRPHLRTWADGMLDLPADLFTPTDDGFLEVSARLDPSPLVPIEPRTVADGRFTGHVSVLIGPANASGATTFAALLKAHRSDVTLVGEPTGGCADGPTAGIIAFLDLPHSGIVVRVPLLRQWSNVPGAVAGQGVQPDLLVPERPGADDADPVIAVARRARR